MWKTTEEAWEKEKTLEKWKGHIFTENDRIFFCEGHNAALDYIVDNFIVSPRGKRGRKKKSAEEK